MAVTEQTPPLIPLSEFPDPAQLKQIRATALVKGHGKAHLAFKALEDSGEGLATVCVLPLGNSPGQQRGFSAQLE
jgi:hypothetical protein